MLQEIASQLQKGDDSYHFQILMRQRDRDGGIEKYSQTLDSPSEYFMTDKWKRLHLVHFLAFQEKSRVKSTKSWDLPKIIKKLWRDDTDIYKLTQNVLHMSS